MDQLFYQFIVGTVAPFVINWLKRMTWFPVISATSLKWVKVIFAAIVAAGSALAVTFAFDPTLGQLTVSGLTWSNVGHGLAAFIFSLFVQHTTYELVVKPNAPKG